MSRSWNPLVAQWVKDPALSVLWHGFDPWAKNFRMSKAWLEKKKNAKVPSLVSPSVRIGNSITETPAPCQLLRKIKASSASQVAVL